MFAFPVLASDCLQFIFEFCPAFYILFVDRSTSACLLLRVLPDDFVPLPDLIKLHILHAGAPLRGGKLRQF